MTNVTAGRAATSAPDGADGADGRSLSDSSPLPGDRTPARPHHPHRPLDTLELPLDRDIFLRTLLRELSGTLQDVVGLEDASGFVSVVGQNMGRQIDNDYREALGVKRLDREQVAQVLVDLKARINGDFHIIEQDDEKIVLGNRSCPFGEKVVGRPALCMMTSNVFGSIAAENLGYAKVELGETIARGFGGCRVIVHLRPTEAADAASGREYFGVEATGGATDDATGDAIGDAAPEAGARESENGAR